MNNSSAAAASERALLARLREMLDGNAWPNEIDEGWSARQETGFDAVVRLEPSGGKPALLLVECKTDMRPSNFPAWARERSEAAAKRRAVLVLAMPFVSERLAALCREAGWSWFDLAENCRIDAPCRLLIERTGIPPVHDVPRPTANLGTAAAARVEGGRTCMSAEPRTRGGYCATTRSERERHARSAYELVARFLDRIG